MEWNEGMLSGWWQFWKMMEEQMAEDNFWLIFNILWFTMKWSDMQWNKGMLSSWWQFWKIMEVGVAKDNFWLIFNILQFSTKWSEMQQNEGMPHEGMGYYVCYGPL